MFCLELFAAEPVVDLGKPGGLDFRNGRLYVLGHEASGVIFEFDVGVDGFIGSQRALVDLNNEVGPKAPRPSGLTSRGPSTVLGSRTEGVSTLMFIDWDAARTSQSLNATVFIDTIDDLGTEPGGPEALELDTRWFVGVADRELTDGVAEVRLYDPDLLEAAERSSDDGVLARSFSSMTPITSMFQARPALVTVEATGNGATLRVLDLAQSIETGMAVVEDTISVEFATPVLAFHTIDAGRIAILADGEVGDGQIAIGRLVEAPAQ